MIIEYKRLATKKLIAIDLSKVEAVGEAVSGTEIYLCGDMIAIDNPYGETMRSWRHAMNMNIPSGCALPYYPTALPTID